MTYKTIIEQEGEISEYLTEWARTYYAKWQPYCHEAACNKAALRAQLKHANKILDFHNSIMGNLENYFGLEVGQHLIPSSFASIDQVLGWLTWMRRYIQEHLPIIEENYKTVGAIYDVTNTHQMMTEFVAIIDRCLKVYSIDSDLPSPYHKLRVLLINGEIDAFVEQLKSIISSIPSSIRKDGYNEAYFHITVHSILSVLGFYPLSEESTNKGRIDMAIRFDERTFIFEFKYSKKKSQANKALKQIKDTDYASKYKLSSSKIIGVGIGFTEEEKNICSHCFEVLYTDDNKYAINHSQQN